jgi:hypothetical protein
VKTGLFEPWGLGDAVIAAAIAREDPQRFVLFCNPKWHPFLRNALPPASLQAATAPYTERGGTLSLADFFKRVGRDSGASVTDLHSIRGDPRDLLFMLFRCAPARIRVNGWLSFFARRIPPLNWLFILGILRVRNRYSRWEEICGLEAGTVLRTYRAAIAKKPLPAERGRVMIHVGAQWRVRQYPHVKELKRLLVSEGLSVQIAAGPKDPLPEGVTEEDVSRLEGDSLVHELVSADWAITNDSGPMHLAAFCGLRTLAIAMISNITEWIPPGAVAVCSSKMPKGYRALPGYTSDAIQEGWPEPKEVVARLARFR